MKRVRGTRCISVRSKRDVVPDGAHNQRLQRYCPVHQDVSTLPRRGFYCSLPGRSRALIYGLAEPRFETRLSESRVTAGSERGLAQLNAVVARLRIGNYLARILARSKISPDQFIDTKLFRTPISTVPFKGEPSATRHTPLATSSAAMG